MGVKVTGGKNDKPVETEEAGGAELTKDEQKAAPDAAGAIDQAAKPDAPAATQPEQDDDGELTTASKFAPSVKIGSGEYQLTYLVAEAKKESGLTRAKWNDLDPAARSEHIQKVIDRVAEEEKASTAATTDDTTVQQDVRVHEDRAVGGRFVAIGGGERIRVAEASTNDELVKDDAELAPPAEEQEADEADDK